MSEPLPPPRVVLSAYLTELERDLSGRGNEPLVAADLLKALRPISQALEEIGRHRAKIAETVQFVSALEARLLIVDDLPTEAPFGALIRRRNGTTAQKATLYTGNGSGEPLARIVPQPL